MSRFERYWTRMLRLHDEEQQLQQAEGLTYPRDPRDLLGRLYKLYPTFPRKHVAWRPGNIIVCQHNIDITKNAQFQQLLTECGYTASDVSLNSTKYKHTFTLVPTALGMIPRDLVPSHAFHVSPRCLRAEIMANGISPIISRSLLDHQGNRVCLLASKDTSPCVSDLSSSAEHDVFEIQTDVDHTYYHDPEYQLELASSNLYTIFSLRNISPHQIKLVT